MSRYVLPNSKDKFVVVGWDPPLNTFFVIVKEEEHADDVILWKGTNLNSILSLDHLKALVMPYCSIPQDVESKLYSDAG